MKKIKVLWMSNRILACTNDISTGGWLKAMAKGLINSGEIELGNISRGRVDKISQQDYGEICQWIVPDMSKYKPISLTLSNKVIRDIVDIVNAYSPDIIHIWGTEDIWGLITARKYTKIPALLEMQGLKKAISRVFHGGLTINEQLACIGIKELVKRTTINDEYKKYVEWEQVDQEIISGHHFITAQTNWIEAQINAINSDAKIFRNARLLRDLFYETAPWQYSEKHIIFCSIAYPSPFKGLHVAIRATAILKEQFPNIQLNIAGFLQKPGIRRDGYIAWLNSEVKKLKLINNVSWLGPLTAAQMVDAIKSSAVLILPSFIENCSNLMQEGMMLGVPIVVSFAGGLPSLASDEESALFFPPGDEIMCAYQIGRLLTDRSLAEKISHKARDIALQRNDYQKVVQKQIEIYHHVKNASIKEI